ncbi:type II secretion system protein [Chthonomonas calidirosea]|uniref:Prepilin-type N-terminal cleavage/methylation domain n=1 Tax=Chthonomonas calidirosea (strain DSM 23976 / ICMP 18418 / T49) TaxID=1303518 RepID=S0EXB2_CHTCT|nr:prepilin-type N-terminal cleavage/methylation domain-containing protein [Chthonomonas calidirosea]CCW36102.1 prepilin-type N-terminal cleavage/methylation domain [Chthonomonas calidirosea T49]CEK17283.1 prepilin-type N-terminal cleavage/methylation domain-containing protein [Chthonomonas calidirosea]CEK18333.1 prepilin-type N-terminal cleavage/methylation domain-containing protein [Chthonomonas calidirosea]
MKRAGFTLIELLVVIAILSILAALLLPVFARARKAALTSQCLSNLHQQGVAIALYQHDYDGYYPYAIDNFTRQFALTAPPDQLDSPYIPYLLKMGDYVALLYPYLKSHEVFHCPAEYHLPGTGPIWQMYRVYGCSYEYYGQWPALFHQTEQYYHDPAEAIIVSDIQPWHGSYGIPPSLYIRSNVLFADFHVKTVSDDYLYTHIPLYAFLP